MAKLNVTFSLIKTNFPGLKKVRHGRISNLIYPEISMLRTAFLELDSKLKEFGRAKCKFHRNQKSKRIGIECDHPAMGYGGINRNTDCELGNCPRVLYGDEGG
jgi:hypothetical protein